MRPMFASACVDWLMCRRWRAGLALLLAAVFCASALEVARAARGLVDVRVLVRDGATGKPIAGALIRFEAKTRKLLGRADLDGEARFVSVPAGDYDLHVTAQDFQDALVVARVDGEADLTLTVALRAGLPQIGSVSARCDTAVVTVSRDAASARLFPDFADVLNRLADASISVDQYGRLGAVSFAGKDASLSTVTFDGVDLSDPVARHAIDPDLIQSARESAASATLDLFTLGPTPWTQYVADDVLSGYHGARTKSTVQTTVGNVGVVGEYASSSQRSALYGARYLDSSGLDYVHRGRFASDSVLLKVTAPLAQRVTAETEFLSTSSRQQPSSPYFSGALPAGSGPGTFSDSSSTIARVGITANPGHFLVQSGLSVVNTNNVTNELARYSAGQPDPLYAQVRGRQVQASLGVVDLVSARETLNLNLSSIANDNHFTTVVPRFQLASLDTRDYTRTTRLSIRDARSFSSAQRLLFGFDESFDNHGNAGLTATASFDVRVGSDDFRLGVSHGRDLASRSSASAFSDPQSASYDCESGTIIVAGPNQQPTAPRASDLRLDWVHKGRRSELNVEVAQTLYSDVSLSSAYVPISSIPVSIVPAGYVASLLGAFTQIGGCPSSLAAPSLYVTENISGAQTRYVTARVIATTHVGSRLQVQWAAEVQRATLVSAPAVLLGIGSPYVPGGQLPGVPLFHATATADLPWQNRRTESILSLGFVSGNNERHLPAYVQLTAGVAHRLSENVDAFLIFANAGHAYVGLFNSPLYAQGVPTIGGGTLRTFAAPLVQPNVHLNVRVKVRHGD